MLAAAVLSLVLALRVTDILGLHGQVTAGALVQVLLAVVLFVVPLMYTFPGAAGLLARYRWPVLAAQAVLTWVPFAVFGGRWQVGIGGVLAGLVLIMVSAPVAWLVAGGLLTADVVIRATVTGLPWSPAWSGALWAVITFADDAIVVFGMIRLAQLIGELQQARGQAAQLAMAGERLAAASALQSAVGERLAAITSMAAAARQALPGDRDLARAQVTAAGQTARESVARARAVIVSRRSLPQPPPATGRQGGAVIGARLAWAVLVFVLCEFAAAGLNDAAHDRIGPRLTALLAAGLVLGVVLQLHHSRAARQGGKPRAWPLTLALQAGLLYMFFIPSVAAYNDLAGFLAGSVLLLVPGPWRWVGYTAVLMSWLALFATVPLHGFTGSGQNLLVTLYEAVGIGYASLLVYGLSRLTATAREMQALRGELARMAAVRERLRVARDVHDLLGLGLSALALKTDLITRLIGLDDRQAAAELAEVTRICAAARADIRLVTIGGQRLSLAGELAAARQILQSAGIEVRSHISSPQLPAAADEVMAPVLREAVTNILRHSAATTCMIEATADREAMRLRVSNDGVTRPAAAPGPAIRTSDGGRGLANMTARLQAAGGHLASCHRDGRFELTAETPLPRPPA